MKNFYPSDWHREHQIVYVKADLVKRVSRSDPKSMSVIIAASTGRIPGQALLLARMN